MRKEEAGKEGQTRAREREREREREKKNEGGRGTRERKVRTGQPHKPALKHILFGHWREPNRPTRTTERGGGQRCERQDGRKVGTDGRTDFTG